MESEWTKVDLRSAADRREVTDDRMLSAQEVLARDLSLNLSAFLRSSIPVKYVSGEESTFGELLKSGSRSSFALALLRPDDWKLLLRVEHSVLFPLIGIALGAKAGTFVSPDRKPTEVELQVVALLFRLILAETYRAWSVPLKKQLESITMEIEQMPARVFAASDSTFVARFELSLGEFSGTLSLMLPASFIAGALIEEKPDHQKAKPAVSSSTTLEMVMPAKVSLDVWLEGSEMRLADLLQLREGQIVKLDHPVNRNVSCTLNGAACSSGQIVSTGSRRAFMLDDPFVLGLPRP